MARKPKNEDIGTVICPICGDKAPVRKDCNGKLYYVGKAGMIKPNMPAGQNWMLENADIWGKGMRPAEAANDSAETVTSAEKIPPVTVKKAVNQLNVPVNGAAPQTAVNDAQSKAVEKQTFTKWLIG